MKEARRNLEAKEVCSFSTELNDWSKEKIVHRDSIKSFDFLMKNNYIKEIADHYFYLSEDIHRVEESFYKSKTIELAKSLGIDDISLEIKGFIKKLNTYNEIKDIAQCLMGKIADLRGVTIKKLHEDFDVSEEEKN
jgi:hypothetical protein